MAGAALAARRVCSYNKDVAEDDFFIWDEAKRASNFRKHGVDFSLAKRFDFDAAIVALDTLKTMANLDPARWAS